MCGITGVVNRNSISVDKNVIEKMTNSLIHRGPDDEGYFFSKNTAFGFRRLSVIDLVTGRQPVHNENKSVWVILNGEIYDYKSVRDSLQKKGHIFYTKSDTEVIVHLYEEYGENFLQYLNGMFSFALWDDTSQSLILARDRMGKKPLYYSLLADKFLFGSEIKALLEHPGCPKEIDYNSLSKYLHYGYVPAPSTIFAGINKLRPSEYLIFKNNEIKINNYWDIPYDKPKLQISFDDASVELRRLIGESVKKRLVSDVPLGLFLSGGIDSSSVAAAMARESNTKIKTFSVAFSEKDYDESRFARIMAKHLGTDHYEEMFSSDTLIGLIPDIANIIDEPLADPSLVPSYLISKFTKSHVTVALGGDGGDEIFAGYPTYFAHHIFDWYNCAPELIKQCVRAVVSRMPVSTKYFSLDFKAKRFLRGENCLPPERHSRWMSSFLPEEIRDLLSGSISSKINLGNIYDEQNYYAKKNTFNDIELAMYLDAKMYLQDNVLAKVDRSSMAVSLEVRAPLLDKDVVEFAAMLPLEYKINKNKYKQILKKAMEKEIPQEILNRKKQGFSLPLSKWFRKELLPLLEIYLNEKRVKAAGIFNPEYVSRLINEHKSGTKEHKKALWTLLVFELWREKYGGN